MCYNVIFFLMFVLMQVDLIWSCRNKCLLKMMGFLLGCFWKGGPCGRQFFHLFGLFLHWQSAYFQFTHTNARLLYFTHVLELYFSLSPFFCVISLSLPLQLYFHSWETLRFSRHFQYHILVIRHIWVTSYDFFACVVLCTLLTSHPSHMHLWWMNIVYLLFIRQQLSEVGFTCWKFLVYVDNLAVAYISSHGLKPNMPHNKLFSSPVYASCCFISWLTML